MLHEHLIVSVSPTTNNSELEAILNLQSQQGWELFLMSKDLWQMMRLFFRRPVKKKPVKKPRKPRGRK